MSDRPSQSPHDRTRNQLRFFPRHLNDSSLIYLCLILASIAGILVVGLSLYRSHLTQIKEAQKAELHKDWIENLIPTQAELIEALLRDVRENRSLVLFEHGTVVIVTEPSEDPRQTAIDLLQEHAITDSIFAVNKVGSDYAVRFKGPIFTRISGTAISLESEWIRKNWQDYVTPEELTKMESQKIKADHATQIGFIARSFLMRDLEALKVTKILKSHPQESQ